MPLLLTAVLLFPSITAAWQRPPFRLHAPTHRPGTARYSLWQFSAFLYFRPWSRPTAFSNTKPLHHTYAATTQTSDRYPDKPGKQSALLWWSFPAAALIFLPVGLRSFQLVRERQQVFRVGRVFCRKFFHAFEFGRQQAEFDLRFFGCFLALALSIWSWLITAKISGFALPCLHTHWRFNSTHSVGKLKGSQLIPSTRIPSRGTSLPSSSNMGLPASRSCWKSRYCCICPSSLFFTAICFRMATKLTSQLFNFKLHGVEIGVCLHGFPVHLLWQNAARVEMMGDLVQIRANLSQGGDEFLRVCSHYWQ